MRSRSGGARHCSGRLAAIVWVVLPFVISQLCAVFVLGRVHGRMRRADGLADRIAEAVKGLPPDQQTFNALSRMRRLSRQTMIISILSAIAMFLLVLGP